MKEKKLDYYKCIDVIVASRNLAYLLEMNMDNDYMPGKIVDLMEKCFCLNGDILNALRSDGYTIEEIVEDFNK